MSAILQRDNDILSEQLQKNESERDTLKARVAELEQKLATVWARLRRLTGDDDPNITLNDLLDSADVEVNCEFERAEEAEERAEAAGARVAELEHQLETQRLYANSLLTAANGRAEAAESEFARLRSSGGVMSEEEAYAVTTSVASVYTPTGRLDYEATDRACAHAVAEEQHARDVARVEQLLERWQPDGSYDRDLLIRGIVMAIDALTEEPAK